VIYDENVLYCRFITGSICAREVKLDFTANVVKCPLYFDKKMIEFPALPISETGEVALQVENHS
jgi:hypothetical protein